MLVYHSVRQFLEMSHEFSLVWRIIVHLPNLTDFPLVVSILIPTKNRAQRLYIRELLSWLVVLLEYFDFVLVLRCGERKA